MRSVEAPAFRRGERHYKDHPDPFDRTLIAQCRVEKLTLLTIDRQIRDREYGIQTVW